MTSTDLDKLRVLLIDDSATARAGLEEILSDLGHIPEAVSSCTAALNRMEEVAFDAILCDLVMPEMDGIEFLKEVRSRGHETPFMLMTAYGSIASAIAALRLGAEEYLLKPIDRELLTHRIEALIGRRRLENELANKQRLEGALAMAGAAAHEFNQPLTAIMGSAELLTMTTDMKRVQELADRIMIEAERLGRLTRKLVKTVRYETKEYAGRTAIVDIDKNDEE